MTSERTAGREEHSRSPPDSRSKGSAISRRAIECALTLTVLLNTGCATFSDLPRPAARNRGEPLFERLSVFVDSGYNPLERTGLWQPQPVKAQERRAIAVLRHSGWAGEIRETQVRANADLEIRVESLRRSRFGTLSLVTLGLIPTRSEGTIKLKLTRTRKPARSCVQVQRYRWWIHLFLFPFMFTNSTSDYELLAVDRLTLRCGLELFRGQHRPAT
jgi:hypothetical protein